MDKQSAVKEQSAPDAASVLAPALKVGALTGKPASSISVSIIACRKSQLYHVHHRSICLFFRTRNPLMLCFAIFSSFFLFYALLSHSKICHLSPACQATSTDHPLGCTGLVVGGVAGVIRDTPAFFFAAASGIQWFGLGTTFWGSRTFLLQAWDTGNGVTPSERVSASTAAGAVAGSGVGLLTRMFAYSLFAFKL